jgi:nitrous oxidase accessory protein NosD
MFMNNKVGVHAMERVEVTIRNSVAMGDPSVGTPVGYQVTTNGSTSIMTVEDSSASHLQSGLRVVETAGTARAFVSNSVFSSNINGTSGSATAEIISFTNNKFSNNTTDQAGPFTTKLQQ